nr:MAG TPA: hypothetical protein [Caudoviricetes sp.]
MFKPAFKHYVKLIIELIRTIRLLVELVIIFIK